MKEDDIRESRGFWPLVAATFLGLLLVAVAFLIRDYSEAFTVVLAIGASLIASIVVILVGRLLPSGPERIRMIKSNEDIYNEFERMLDGLDKERPHVIRTVNSFLPQPMTENRWDKCVVSFLTNSPKSRFIRVIFHRDTEEWRKRFEQIRRQYSGLDNYHQHRHGEPSPPAIEMFLVDKNEVLLSFAAPEVKVPSVTFGIKLRDKRLCEELEAYHRNQLECRIPKEKLDQDDGECNPGAGPSS